MTETATFVLVPINAPSAYWEGWATPCGTSMDAGGLMRIVATRRTGSTGRSDAQYIIDRMASDLHFAKLYEAPEAPEAPHSYAEALAQSPEARGLVPEPDYPWPADDEPDDPSDLWEYGYEGHGYWGAH
jgi:hypothetical protein